VGVNRPATSVTTQQIQLYRDQGYLQLPHLFSSEEMDALRAALDHIIEQGRARVLGEDREHDEDFKQVFLQLVNLWVDQPEVRSFTFDRRLADIARQLAECRAVLLHHDQALIKPGGDWSRATNWHQDAPYYPMQQSDALSAWIAVDDVSTENGCLQFLPGSHRFGSLELVPFDVEGASIFDQLAQQGVTLDAAPVSMAMAAGGVSFHHGCLFHYASPNRTERPRRAFTIIYTPDHVTYDGGWDPAGATDLEVGEPFSGPQHPVLSVARR